MPLASMEQQKEMDILVGEAYFLRAHHYLELVKRWGGVPIMRDIIAPDKNYRPVREDVKTCLDYIVEDCMFAAKNCRVKVSSLWGRESHERGCVRIESAYITIWGQSLLGSKRLGHNVEAGCGRRLGGHKPER